jgi:hypothetical protein
MPATDEACFEWEQGGTGSNARHGRSLCFRRAAPEQCLPESAECCSILVMEVRAGFVDVVIGIPPRHARFEHDFECAATCSYPARGKAPAARATCRGGGGLPSF